MNRNYVGQRKPELSTQPLCCITFCSCLLLLLRCRPCMAQWALKSSFQLIILRVVEEGLFGWGDHLVTFWFCCGGICSHWSFLVCLLFLWGGGEGFMSQSFISVISILVTFLVLGFFFVVEFVFAGWCCAWGDVVPKFYLCNKRLVIFRVFFCSEVCFCWLLLCVRGCCLVSPSFISVTSVW